MPTEKPTGKKALTQKSFMDEARGFADEWKQKALTWAQDFERFRNIVQNNYDLGREHLARGNIKDAILRFRFVLWLDSKYKDTYYHLGCSYLIDNNLRAARDALTKALKLSPVNNDARYMLSIAMGRAMPKAELPKSIPRHLLIEQFDSIAPNYAAEQLGTFKYEGHTHLANAIRSGITLGRMDHIILELGVGTGLCGPLLRDVASHITGIDLSPAMLTEATKVTDARGVKAYDALICREAVEFLMDGPDGGYDIVMGAGLVSYLGDLQPFFEHSARIMKPGGMLAFTADNFDGTGFQFNPETGRFGYAQYYLADLATRYGLTEFRCREASIYPESAGWLCVYRK